ncbi:YecA family protein [Siminovitchia sp. 179-K 8D1 HS]|uniref:YecA family protein n=1 Tax=Siminovitchia sp. 179-K 8D1 HS TaxID=3142385 RepID=UPI0039A39F37
MTGNLSEKELEQMLFALDKLKETTAKIRQRKELKIWGDMAVPITLYDGLSKLTKDELSDIRNRTGIKGASRLNKGELIELFQEKIPKMLGQICLWMDLERCKLLQKIIQNGGYILAGPLELEEIQVEYLRSTGFIFTGTHQGERILAIPQDLIEPLSLIVNDKKFLSIMKRNTEWIRLTYGLLYYYGTLTINQLTKFIEKYSAYDFILSEYLSLMDNAQSYYQETRFEQAGLSNIRVFDPDQVKKEHKLRKDLDFFPFSKEQLLKAGEPGFVDQTKGFRQFVHFLTQNYEITKEEAELIAEECVYATRIDHGPKDIFSFLQTRLEFTDLDGIQACMEKVIHLMNDTRQWILKGYTSDELFEQEKKLLKPIPTSPTKPEEKKKIGRNDPCPCGSGKKYKKCCGKH